MAALTFCFDTLKTGGHFVCKYYQGNEEKDLELRLKKLFEKVHREKPESSRNVRISHIFHDLLLHIDYRRDTKVGMAFRTLAFRIRTKY
jgi:hypothetical protein